MHSNASVLVVGNLREPLLLADEGEAGAALVPLL